MKFKPLFLVVALTVLISCCSFAGAETAQPYASEHLSDYIIGLSKGSSTGDIIVEYSVCGTGTMKTIGISKIVIYNAAGTPVKTVYGSNANGLLASDSVRHSGNYSYTGISGALYYAVVTVYAGDNTGSSVREITTNSVLAP